MQSGSVGIREVAARAGVSPSTVSNALNRPDRLDPGTLERVQAAMVELGFVRNAAARQLRVGPSNTFGMVVPDIVDPYYAGLVHECEQVAAVSGFDIVVGNSDGRVGREDQLVQLFEEQRFRGLLLAPIREGTARMKAVAAHGIPAVILGPRGEASASPAVMVDDVAGGALAAQHLIDIGRHRIVIVGNDAVFAADRRRGAEGAVSKASGVEMTSHLTTDLSFDEGLRVGRDLAAMGQRPDAVFAVNDVLALGILQAFVLAQVSVPGDVAIVGYDDIGWAARAIVPLTSIAQAREELAQHAVRLLLAPPASPDTVVLTPTLVVRESTVAAPA